MYSVSQQCKSELFSEENVDQLQLNVGAGGEGRTPDILITNLNQGHSQTLTGADLSANKDSQSTEAQADVALRCKSQCKSVTPTMDNLVWIFNSNYLSRNAHEYREALQCWEQGAITVSRTNIPLVQPTLAEVAIIRRARIGNESQRHVTLKHSAAMWLRSLGGIVRFEFPVHGSRFDVAAENLKIGVECGGSTPSQIEFLFGDSGIDLLAIAPYRPGDPGQTSLYLICAVGDSGSKFIEERTQRIFETVSRIANPEASL